MFAFTWYEWKEIISFVKKMICNATIIIFLASVKLFLKELGWLNNTYLQVNM